MGQVAGWLKNALFYAGVVVLAIAGILLFAAAAVAMRLLLVAALLVAGLGCLVLYLVSPAFREWYKSVGQWQIDCKGLRLATDIAVHPSHSWARMAPDDVAVGADDLVQASLGPVEAVELPPVGSHVEQGDRLFCLRRGERRIQVRTPVSGTVVNRNETLIEHPELVNEGPFDEGWAVRLRPDDVQKDTPSLLRGKRARNWFRREIDRLVDTVLSQDTAAPSLADGGTVVGDFYQQIDEGAWKRLTETFFGIGPKGSTGP